MFIRNPQAKWTPIACVASAASPSIRHVTSLKEIAPRYKAVLLDQFGVLHDGKHPYKAAVQAVKQLHEAGLKIYIISNSSRRSSGTFKKLTKLGFEESWFEGAVTSGDMAYQFLKKRPSQWWQNLGSSCIHFTWSSRGIISLEDLDLEVTSDPQRAMFILSHGTEALGMPQSLPQDMSLEAMQELMRACSARGLPMVVANPDLVTVDGPGSLAVMPGTLAKWYKEMGGSVHLMGKPDSIIYEAAMGALGLDPAQVLAIGDSLEHDIAGAAAAGVDSLFIAGGIHAEELNVRGDSYSREALTPLYNKFEAEPTFCMPFLEW